MSHLMTALAMREPGLKPAQKIVLYWLADHHNGETGLCCPSVSRIAELAEVTSRSVLRSLSDLEEMGLISRLKRLRDNGGRRSSQYILNLSQSQENKGCQNDPPPNEKMSGGATTKCREGLRQNVTPLTLEDNNLGSKNLSSSDEEECAREAIELWNDAASKSDWPKVQKISKDRIKSVRARLKECDGIEGWKVALEKATESAFLRSSSWFSFDWITKPRNFTKLMEGNYDNRNNQGNGSGNSGGGSAHDNLLAGFARSANSDD